MYDQDNHDETFGGTPQNGADPESTGGPQANAADSYSNGGTGSGSTNNADSGAYNAAGGSTYNTDSSAYGSSAGSSTYGSADTDSTYGSGTGRSSADSSSEYRYTRDSIPHPSYMDANYVPHEETQSGPRSYYTPPVTPPPKAPKAKKEKKPRKPVNPMVKWIAACLVCALLGGIGGGALVASRTSSTAAPTTSSSSELTKSDSTASAGTSATAVASGQTLTGSQIYSLGCKQAVGITTEITSTNYFGMQSTSAVSGSGFIVTSDGYIVTNYHVIADAYTGGYKVSVMTYDGKKYDAEIKGVDASNDIAVLKINATGLSAATLGSSNSLQVGETIYAIGNPLGELSFSLTSGTVSALDRDITTRDSTTGETTTNNMFQFDAAVNEGNSGGPVYNTKGEVVGIVTAKYSSTGVEGLSFAIPIDDVSDIISQLMKQGYVSGEPSLGITVKTVDSAVAQYYNMVEGAYIDTVNAGSCSEKAGLKVGDIITAINDTKVTSVTELAAAKKTYKAGETVTLKVYRQGKTIDVKVTLDEAKSTASSSSSSSSNNSNSSGSTFSFGSDSTQELPTVPKTA